MRPIAVTIADAVNMTGIGRTKLYEEIKAGRLKPRKSGRRTLFLIDDLEAYARALPLADMPEAGALTMLDPQTRIAAPTGIGSGGEIEGTGSVFKSETYRSPATRTLPSSEDPSRLARVIPHAGRLFAVQTFREPRP